MNKYRLSCLEFGVRHVKFNVFDPIGANCGTLTVEADDVVNFLQNSWKGDLFWEGKAPVELPPQRPYNK